MSADPLIRLGPGGDFERTPRWRQPSPMEAALAIGYVSLGLGLMAGLGGWLLGTAWLCGVAGGAAGLALFVGRR